MVTFAYGEAAMQGDQFAVPVPNDLEGRYYIPVDVTGYTASLEIRAYPLLEDPPVVSLSQGAGIDVTPLAGLFKVTQETTDTMDVWDPDQYEYSLVITSPTSEIIEVARGTLTLEPQIVT